ncbi:MAG: low specificity L-threonine aldolase [Alphaproteobacteria bacterium]|nr:low specificity L-threonine aldolase [Alphaproteobacteria bacterium]
MDFRSDNVAGAAPEILAAVIAANVGAVTSYGGDPLTLQLQAKVAALFETEVDVFPVVTGTAANALALALLTPPYGAIYSHADAHPAGDECGAPEFYSGGAKVVPLPGADGRIAAATLAQAIAAAEPGTVHHVQPASVTLTQATEAGTVYRPEQIAALAAVAHANGLGVHMDGARFANAVAFLGCAPADITWRAGVDALTFGATKGGALAAEAVVLFRRERAAELGFRRKRAGHLLSKMRFVSAQLDAYVTGGLWLRLAGHANALARRLGEGLAGVPGVTFRFPVEANEVFPEMPEAMIAGLARAGFRFHRWGGPGSRTLRLVVAFDGREADVDALVAAARRLA